MIFDQELRLVKLKMSELLAPNDSFGDKQAQGHIFKV